MRDAAIAAMVCVWCKRSNAILVLQFEGKLQAGRVIWAANKTFARGEAVSGLGCWFHSFGSLGKGCLMGNRS